MSENLTILILAAAVSAAIPLLLAALGETVIELSGVVNLSVEGMMLIAALTAFWADTQFESAWLGILAAFFVTAAVGVMFAGMTVSLGCNQVVVGLAFNVVAAGLTSYLGRSLVGVAPAAIPGPIDLPVLAEIPIIGPVLFRQPLMAYGTLLLVPVLGFILFKTHLGLNLRAVGESPDTADASGISVIKYRYSALVVGSAIIGLAGAYLATSIAPAWTDNLTAGRGWIAVALVIFGGWRPAVVLLGSLLFGLVEALSYHAQALNLPISTYLLQSAPYLFTILGLALGVRYSSRLKSGAPAALGNFWRRN